MYLGIRKFFVVVFFNQKDAAHFFGGARTKLYWHCVMAGCDYVDCDVDGFDVLWHDSYVYE